MNAKTEEHLYMNNNLYLNMTRYVSEIFGFPPSNKTEGVNKIRKEFKCPYYSGFPKGQCDPVNKKSNLTDEDGKPMLHHQSGACSVLHMHRGLENSTPVIICPYRFFERDNSGKLVIFDYIKQKFFGGKDLILVPEIGLCVYGRADGILCQISHKGDSEFTVHDYAHLELQSDATTATRELVQCVKDFFDGKDITKNNYTYGLNSKASIKGSSLQMIDKGYLFKHFGKKSIWIIQDSLFHILCSIYNVKMTDITNTNPQKDENLIFVVVSSKYDKLEDRYKIYVSKSYSTSPDLLQKAISQKAPIDESDIMDSVLTKISGKIFQKI